MKRGFLLFALFLCLGSASKAQSISEIRDTLHAVAPHIPATHRWTEGDGKKWHDGVEAQFTQATQDTVKMWMQDYSEEAHDYKSLFEAYFTSPTTPMTGLSETDAEIYWELHAVWMMIYANHDHGSGHGSGH